MTPGFNPTMTTSAPATASLLLLLLPFPPTAATAYEALEAYNFPEGILPKGVTGYELDPATGRFSFDLNSSCSFSLVGSYHLRYKPVGTRVESRFQWGVDWDDSVNG